MDQDFRCAELELIGNLAVIRFANPPVNAMSPGVPGAVIEKLTKAVQDDAKAVLLVPGGTGVLAGADITMHGKEWPVAEPKMSDLIHELENLAVPTAMLMRKSALGGGLEIAMACNWRFATAQTQIGQPEVNLGIPPGAGGTQRLPRIVGAKQALDLCLQGRTINAVKGHELGLVDLVVRDETATEDAIEFMQAALKAGEVPTAVGSRVVECASPSDFEDARKMAAKRRRGEAAPLAIIECIEAATRLPIDEGLAFERKHYLECVSSPQAAAMRAVFFAERAALKGHTDPGARVKPINKIAVIGAGTMGSGIAIAFLMAGIHVHVAEMSEDALQAGARRIDMFFQSRVKSGRMAKDKADEIVSRLTCEASVDVLPEVDLVIEAVFENLDVKKAVFTKLRDTTKPGTILATNTSYLSIDEIADAVPDRKGDVIGMHFFSPANIMPLLEIVRGAATSEDTLATVLDLSKKIKKVGVVSGVCHGFIANRSFSKYLREAEFLLQEGASPEHVDTVLRSFGMPMGPFAVRDLAGLDIGWANRKATAHLRDPKERYSVVGDVICERGWYGQKNGRGFFNYEEGTNKRVENPDVEGIIRSSAKADGIVPRDLTDQEIVDRCMLIVVNEGAKILEEGIARRSSDFDLAWINGYGFPKWRGGPLAWADRTGLPEVVARMTEFSKISDFWEPATLLTKLASEGGTFANFTGVDQ